MIIEELSSVAPNKHVTVTLNYEEVRDIANGLYHASKNDLQYKSIKNKCKFLFDMVKTGMIQPETVEDMSETMKGKE